jgi:hypothetical protein
MQFAEAYKNLFNLINYVLQAVHGIFAHSRPDKSGLRGVPKIIGTNPLKYHVLPVFVGTLSKLYAI